MKKSREGQSVVDDVTTSYELPDLSSVGQVRYEQVLPLNGGQVNLGNANTLTMLLPRADFVAPARNGVCATLEFDLTVSAAAGATAANAGTLNPFDLFTDVYVIVNGTQTMPQFLGQFRKYWQAWWNRQSLQFQQQYGAGAGYQTNDDFGTISNPLYIRPPFILPAAGNSTTQHYVLPLPPLGPLNNPHASFPCKLLNRVQMQIITGPYANALTSSAGFGLPPPTVGGAAWSVAMSNLQMNTPFMAVDPRVEDAINARLMAADAGDPSQAIVLETSAVSVFNTQLADQSGSQNIVWQPGTQFSEFLEMLFTPSAPVAANCLWTGGSVRTGISQYQVFVDGHPESPLPVTCTIPNIPAAAASYNNVKGATTPYFRYLQMAEALNRRDRSDDKGTAVNVSQTWGSSGVVAIANGATEVPEVLPWFAIASPLGVALGDDDASVPVQTMSVKISKAQAGGADVYTTSACDVCALVHGRGRIFLTATNCRAQF